jgi:hypothetical protein
MAHLQHRHLDRGAGHRAPFTLTRPTRPVAADKGPRFAIATVVGLIFAIICAYPIQQLLPDQAGTACAAPSKRTPPGLH